MKKRVVVALLVALVLFWLLPAVSGGINEKIDSIVNYAEDYEMGKINYLQLIVYGNTIREEINRELGQEYNIEGDWVHLGLSEEDVKKLFGKPTEMTSWVWVINEEHDEYVDEKLPKWEKRLFDGRKIIITFNAWPQIIKREDEIIKLYEVDFNIRFKTHYEFNLDDMLREIKYKASQYVESKQNGEELIEKIVEYQRFLWGYLEQNNDDCKNVMKEFFDSEHKQEQQKKVRFMVIAYEGKNLLLRINAEACESCDWPHANMWFDIDVFGRGFEPPEGKKEQLEKDFDESWKEKSIEELNAELEDTLDQLVSLAEESDRAGRFKDPERIAYLRTILDKLNMFLDQKHYDDQRFREENYEKRLAFITSLLGKYGEVEKEALTEIRYENRLVEESEEITRKSCKHVGDFSCNLDEGCLDGECVEAKGGLEDCHNGKDDDNDGIIDCPDPDCATECGWICKDACQEECWPCNNKECMSECEECWNCKGDDCEDVCRDTCWKCQQDKCESQDFCKDCTACQKNAWVEYQEERCNLICDLNEDSKDCESCREEVKRQECRPICQETCWKCKEEYCHESGGACQKCWDCQNDGKDNSQCKEYCKECWQCENEYCYDKEICSECRECEEEVNREIQKERCDKACDRCDTGKGENDCKECENCRMEEKRHICDEVCQDECWPCNDEKCGNMCEDCWSLETDDKKKQEEICQDCWDCTWDKCGSQDFCTSCKECENRIYMEEHPCELPCDMCEDCKERRDDDEDYCIDACDECFDCETPDNAKKCIKACNKIIYDEDDKEQREKCYGFCHEGVIFYCNGMPQDTPCLQTYYSCPGGSQRIPCDFFICTYEDGTVVKQTAMCGMENVCGERRKWINKQCVCDTGWYDCDEDPLNGCERETPCGEAKEICNDVLDNDFDGLIDCQDLSDCEAQRCDLYSTDICKEGECVKNCPENYVLDDNDECVPIEVCMVGYEYDEEGKCVRPQNETINETVNETVVPPTNVSINETGNVSVPPTNITTNETGNVTVPQTNVSINETGNVSVPPTNVTINDTKNVTECLKEGENYMTGDYKQCCDGLKAMSVQVGNGIICSLTAGYVCTANCGDGKCEGKENPCNCPEDCPVILNVTKSNITQPPENVTNVTTCHEGQELNEEGECVEECLNEGEYSGDNEHCCDGLTAMSIQVGDGTVCSLTEGYICTALCGDGKCEGDENPCNCEDCPKPEEENISCTVDSDCGADSCQQGRGKCVEIKYVCENGECSGAQTEFPGFICHENICEDSCGNEICEEGYEKLHCPEDCKEKELKCAKCGNSCVPMNDVTVMDCIRTTQKFDCEVVDGKCTVTNLEECPEGYHMDEEDGECVPDEIQLECTQCGDGCLPLEELAAAYCTEPTKEIYCIEEDGKCVAVEIEEPPEPSPEQPEEEPPEPPKPPKEEIECPDGYYFKDDKCLFIENEEEVCLPWQILTKKGVCEDVGEEEEPEEEEPEKEEIEIIETDKRCAVREDCEDENAICSKGICKIIPEEVIEEEEIILIEKVEIEEVPEIPEEEEETEEEVKEIGEKIEEEEEKEETQEPEDKEEPEEEEIKEVVEKEPEEEEVKDEEIPEKEEPEEEEKEEIKDIEEAEEEEPQEEEKEEIEEEPEEEEKEEPSPTGNFVLGYSDSSDYPLSSLLTGWVTKERECENDEDCGKNRGCDTYQGKCHCYEYFFDCNGNGEGNDADGCESQDPTCGGKWDACRYECMPNQVCIEELGRCECEKGFQDCDGDWENGCEATEECEECTTDDDCAPSRCTGWDNSAVKFACVDENPYTEETAIVSFSGGCNMRATGKTESYLNFDTWGRELEELNELRYMVESKSGHGWCEREMDGLIKQRGELENSFDQEFLEWFFEDYVAASPAEWEKHISGIFATYWRFVDNARQIHEMSRCIGDSDFDVSLIDIEYKSEYGEMHYWEERKNLDGREIITPFMQIWVFPPEEFIKEEFRAAMREGRMPGPEGEQKGPSPKEIEETKKNEEVMEQVRKWSDKYGGSADFLIEVKDEDETLFKVLMNINPEDVFKIEIINEDNPYNEEPDINVVVAFDFLYGTIKTFEKDAHLESPPWARKPRGIIKEVVSKGMIFAKISGAIVKGDIKVSPITAMPTVLNLLKFMAGGSM